MKNRVRTSICVILNAPWVYRHQMGIIFLRICVGLLMLTHGLPKLWMLLCGDGNEWLDPLGIGGTASLALCAFAEVFCSLLIIVGLFTRMASLVLLVNFWVAVYVVHAQGGGAQAELPLLYLVCYGTLVCTGAGPLSLDSRLKRRLHCCRYSATAGGGSTRGCSASASAASVK